MNKKKPKTQPMDQSMNACFTRVEAQPGAVCMIRLDAPQASIARPQATVYVLLAKQAAKERERRMNLLAKETIFRRKLSF